MIRSVQESDISAICDIYNHFILETTATFEEIPVDSASIQQKIAKIQQAGLPWLVVEADDQVLGYTYASPWRERSAYRFSVESSIYLHPQRIGDGLGSRLYSALLDELRAKGIHCVMGGIALPNPASIALSEKFGFQKIAHFHQVGWKQNRWVDVGYCSCCYSAYLTTAVATPTNESAQP